MSSTPTRRPGSVTTVMVLTWLVAILTVISGVLLLTASEEILSDIGVAKSDATIYGWVDIVLGVIIALVAIGLGNGNNFSRFLVTVLMVLRIAAMLFAMFVLFGHPGFWFAAAGGAFALIVLILLWNRTASEFFRTN